MPANVILTRPVKGSALKSWAARLPLRAGMRKAKVALARKLATVLHRMLARWQAVRCSASGGGGLRRGGDIEIRAGWGASGSRRGPVAGTMEGVRP
jgi:hypothetical protein